MGVIASFERVDYDTNESPDSHRSQMIQCASVMDIAQMVDALMTEHPEVKKILSAKAMFDKLMGVTGGKPQDEPEVKKAKGDSVKVFEVSGTSDIESLSDLIDILKRASK